MGYSSDESEGKKTLGAYTWLDAEKDKYAPHRWTGQIIDILLAALLAEWVTWIFNLNEIWILLIAAFSFAIIFLLGKRGFAVKDLEHSDSES